MRNYLTDQLDEDLVNAARAVPGPARRDDDGPPAGRGPASAAQPGPAARSTRSSGRSAAARCSADGPGDERRCRARRSTVLDGVPADGRVHAVDLPALGSYRVTRRGPLASGRHRRRPVVIGLPTSDVDDTLRHLVWLGGAARLLGVLAAAGARSYVVRRQLRPLREVAADRAHGRRAAAGLRRDRPRRAGARAPDRRAHRGRPGGRRAQHAARARRVVAGGAAPQRAAGAPVRRRRLARAAHAAGHDRGLHRAGPAPAGRRRDHPDRARQGRGGVRPDDHAGRGPAAAGPAGLRAAAAARARST